MNRLISLYKRQRATDSCADNVFLLDLILRDHHTRHKALHVVYIDVAKAFGTVAHSAIMQTLGARGCPEPMLDYVRSVYSDATATITSDGWQSHAIHSSQGVRQGDPLSPFILNMEMYRLQTSPPDKVGADIDGVKVGAIAFAEYLVLTASKRLKPQQRLFALRIYLLPGLYHAASLRAIRFGALKKCHQIIRSTVRRWLDLPADTPVAYFHADIKSGGLEVPSLRTISMNRLNRLEKLRQHEIAVTKGLIHGKRSVALLGSSRFLPESSWW